MIAALAWLAGWPGPRPGRGAIRDATLVLMALAWALVGVVVGRLL